ncbi:MAG: MauE/DoxX family redox-associated membrane protein [Gaiellaceae bacterium]
MDVIGELAAVGARFFVAFVFLQAGVAKLVAMSDFRNAVTRYELIPSRLVPFFAGTLPRVEVAAGFALIVGVGIRFAAAVVAGLLLCFTVAIGANLARGRTIDCGCSSSTAPEQIGWGLVARNLGLVGLVALVAIRNPSALAVEAIWREEAVVSTTDAVAIVLTAGALFLGWTLAKAAWRFREAVSRFSEQELSA